MTFLVDLFYRKTASEAFKITLTHVMCMTTQEPISLPEFKSFNHHEKLRKLQVFSFKDSKCCFCLVQFDKVEFFLFDFCLVSGRIIIVNPFVPSVNMDRFCSTIFLRLVIGKWDLCYFKSILVEKIVWQSFVEREIFWEMTKIWQMCSNRH